jgi:catechol 2,3-dioxygenase-like lactoylglutathione lyase family enzyme
MSAAGATTEPRAHVTGIDHVVVAVADLDVAVRRWTSLGFTVSPRGFHSDGLGTANHTLMLDQGYVELLGVVQPTAANAWLRAVLASGRGLCAVAAATPDALALHTAWHATGFTVQPVQHFGRAVMRPHGVEQAHFTTVDLAPGALPGADLFACQQHTPQWVWLPELTHHANGSIGLSAVGLPMPASGLNDWARALGPAAPADGALWLSDTSAPPLASPQRLFVAAQATLILRRAAGSRAWPARHAIDDLTLIFEDPT